MSLEEQLKQEILGRYKSIREFSAMTGIPYSTVDSVLKRGIKNSGVGTVIKIFSFLDIDVESISSETLKRINTLEKTKNPPSTDESALGGGRISIEDSNRLLVDLGLIQEGQDLSDDDFAFLSNIVGLLDAWFGKHP